MARVSRKDRKTQSQIQTKIWNTALYIRLSVEDNGKESDSIDNQIAILKSYVANHDDMNIIGIYIDNGYTGTNFVRPDFQRMMDSVKNSRVNCIIVKDLSRLGRNYIETSSFIEKICPLYSLRFISVNDHFDTESNRGDIHLSVSLSNIINDYYAKDISRKSSTALRAKMDRGEFVGNYAPYGYIKDPHNKNHLIIDAEAAQIVRQVFQWRSEGVSYMGINRRLNEAAIPSPGQHRLDMGIETNNNKKGKIILWNKHVITDILCNPVYLGHLAQGKHSQELYNGVPFHRTAVEEWRVVRNTHESIIDEALFEEVQTINKMACEKSKSNVGKYDHLPKEKNIYGKKLRCAHCGAIMKLHRSFNTKRDKAYFTFKCPTYAEHGVAGCMDVKIQKERLDEVLLELIKLQMDVFMNAEHITRIVQENIKHSATDSTGQSEKKLYVEIQRKESLLKDMYIDLKNGIFTLDEYVQHKAIIVSQIEKLKEEVASINQDAHSSDSIFIAINHWRSLIEKFEHESVMSEAMVNALIESILVSHDGSLDVRLCFTDILKLDGRNLAI